MNDDADTPQPDGGLLAVLAGVLFELIPGTAGVAMVAAIVLGLLNAYVIEPHFCPTPTDPEGPHCADARGNATCVEYYGVDQPYCQRSVIVFHGCVSKRPEPSDAAPCGILAEGLPNDPTCAKVVANYVPSPDDTPAVCKVMAVLDRLPWLIFTSLVVVCTMLAIVVKVIKPMIFRARARAARERRTRVVASVASDLPKPSLPPPRVGGDSRPEADDQQS